MSTHHQLFLAPPLLLERHSFLVLFEILAFRGLQVEPRVRERFDVGQQRFYERVKFILRKTEKRKRPVSYYVRDIVAIIIIIIIRYID